MSNDTEIVDAPAFGPVDAPTREWRDVVDELESNGYVRLLTMLEKAGASNRAIARLVGMSEATIRRDFATFDAVRSGKFNDINSGDDDTASNDASPPLKAILRNVPKLTAAEREVVRKELDIADIEQPEGRRPAPRPQMGETASRSRAPLHAEVIAVRIESDDG
jgi:hypothetical protein